MTQRLQLCGLKWFEETSRINEDLISYNDNSYEGFFL